MNEPVTVTLLVSGAGTSKPGSDGNLRGCRSSFSDNPNRSHSANYAEPDLLPERSLALPTSAPLLPGSE
jgi:hypothetical protein